MSAAATPKVVIFVQENHTTDNYFGSMAPFGANVATGWPAGQNPPASDQNHNRPAYWRWLSAKLGGASAAGKHVQYDAATLLPFYDYLAKTGTFFENHCAAFGTNSTPNHLAIVGGQTPTLKNPPFSGSPSWDMPSVPQRAAEAGLTWKCYAGKSGYPFQFYSKLAGSPNVVASDQFITDAQAGALPDISFVYHDAPYDEHPTADITLGHNKIWQYVTAAVQGGEWQNTVFMITWDDWGGFDDHVMTPVTEYTPDNVQVAYGPRLPLIMFGGRVKPGIDSRWTSHSAIAKTALQLLGLKPLGVPRADNDPGLADRVDPTLSIAAPPAFGSTITPPAPPTPAPAPNPLPPYPAAAPRAMDPVFLNDGSTLPAPTDAPLPQQPAPPASSNPLVKLTATLRRLGRQRQQRDNGRDGIS